MRDATAEYERYWTPGVVIAFESYMEDLSNWYIRRSRRRFWDDDTAALRALYDSLTQALRVIAPVMPFLADHLWRHLVGPTSRCTSRRGPRPTPSTTTLLAEVADVRRVVELGRRARDEARLKLRQPLRRLVTEGAPLAASHADEIADELRVKEVVFGDGRGVRAAREAEPAGARPEARVPSSVPMREQLARGEFEELDGGRFQVDGHVLEPDEVLVERVGREGWAVASDAGVTVALDTALDDELVVEAKLLDRVHEINVLRRETGLAITDRIKLWLPDADLIERYRDRLMSETLAVAVELGDLRIERA